MVPSWQHKGILQTLTTAKNWGDLRETTIPRKLCELSVCRHLQVAKSIQGESQSILVLSGVGGRRYIYYFILYATVLTNALCTQVKQEYDVVKELQGLSGFRWDATLCTVTAEPDVWSTYIKVSSGGMWHPQRTHEYVKMWPKRGPWSQRIQGDCRGGYQTLLWWILLYYSPAEEDIRLRVLFPYSAGNNNLTKLLPKEETQLGDCTVTNEQNTKNNRIYCP